jgi:hypothetical protein
MRSHALVLAGRGSRFKDDAGRGKNLLDTHRHPDTPLSHISGLRCGEVKPNRV